MPTLFALVEHSIPGRTRLRIPALRGNAAGLQRLAEGLRGCPGVNQIEIRPVTGCLLVRHQTTSAALASFAGEQGLMHLDGGLGIVPPTTQEAAPTMTATRAGLPSFELILIALLILAAGVQIYRGHLLEPATKLLWYALSLAQRMPPLGDA